MIVIKQGGHTYLQITNKNSIRAYGCPGVRDGFTVLIEGIFLRVGDPYIITMDDDKHRFDDITPYYQYEGEMLVEYYLANEETDWKVNFHHMSLDEEVIDYMRSYFPEELI